MKIGADFEKQNNANVGNIGLAKTRLISQRKLVDFAVKWMEKNRG